MIYYAKPEDDSKPTINNWRNFWFVMPLDTVKITRTSKIVFLWLDEDEQKIRVDIAAADSGLIGEENDYIEYPNLLQEIKYAFIKYLFED